MNNSKFTSLNSFISALCPSIAICEKSGSKFFKLPQLTSYNNLEMLDLSSTSIETIQEITFFEKLQIFIANYNNITWCPSLVELKCLRKLCLNNNLILTLPNDIGLCSYLRILEGFLSIFKYNLFL
jgi:Leucine-rich repeat (LRR) protein